jgi:hypothetical protein
MSTPISTLPLKTQQVNSTDVNDINDPIVQDVLNEFQEELRHTSNQSKSYPQMPSPQQQMPPQHSHHPQMPPHHPSHPSHPSYPPHPQMPPMMYPQQNWSGKSNGNKYDSVASYLDIEVAKRSLILVIVSLIIYHSGIINIAYEKMPEYLQDNLTNFDIYIKSASLFSIIYVLSFFEYI